MIYLVHPTLNKFVIFHSEREALLDAYGCRDWTKISGDTKAELNPKPIRIVHYNKPIYRITSVVNNITKRFGYVPCSSIDHLYLFLSVETRDIVKNHILVHQLSY